MEQILKHRFRLQVLITLDDENNCWLYKSTEVDKMSNLTIHVNCFEVTMATWVKGPVKFDPPTGISIY